MNDYTELIRRLRMAHLTSRGITILRRQAADAIEELNADVRSIVRSIERGVMDRICELETKVAAGRSNKELGDELSRWLMNNKSCTDDESYNLIYDAAERLRGSE